MSDTCDYKPKPKNVKDLIRSWYFWKPALAVIIGGIAGYAYYYFVGCASGTCAITSSPYTSIGFGAFMGYFMVNSPCASGNC